MPSQWREIAGGDGYGRQQRYRCGAQAGLHRARARAGADAARGRRRDREEPADLRAHHRGDGRARHLQDAAAEIDRRRRDRSADLYRRPRNPRFRRRQHRVVAGPELGLLDDRALPLARDGEGSLRRAARHPRLGAGDSGRRQVRRGRRRLPRDRALGLRHRQPARELDRRALPGVRGGRQPADGAERPAGHPHDAGAEIRGHDHRQLAGARPARHRQRQL